MEFIRLEARKELARREFRYYCKLFASRFLHRRKALFKRLVWTVEAVAESDKKILVINMPPRFGKSRTATLFVQWLGKDPSPKDDFVIFFSQIFEPSFFWKFIYYEKSTFSQIHNLTSF